MKSLAFLKPALALAGLCAIALGGRVASSNTEISVGGTTAVFGAGRSAVCDAFFRMGIAHMIKPVVKDQLRRGNDKFGTRH